MGILGFPLPPGSTSPAAPQSTDQDDDVLVKLNASWNFNDNNMAYFTYSEGYRHGGAQAVPSLDNGDPFGEPNAEGIRTFKSDSVQNYELGVKGGYGRFQYTANAFYVDWQDPQLNTTSVFFGFYLAANGDQATTRGIELEAEGYLGDSFTTGRATRSSTPSLRRTSSARRRAASWRRRARPCRARRRACSA
jgi:outer membrane receptor protein involved in Fe transport